MRTSWSTTPFFSNKNAAATRYGISWRAVNDMCEPVVTEALGLIDVLDGLVAISIDEVKYKKGPKYLTVVCDHLITAPPLSTGARCTPELRANESTG